MYNLQLYVYEQYYLIALVLKMQVLSVYLTVYIVTARYIKYMCIWDLRGCVHEQWDDSFENQTCQNCTVQDMYVWALNDII